MPLTPLTFAGKQGQAPARGIVPAAVFADDDFPAGGGIIAAVSGGGDSLALLFLLHEFLQEKGQAERLTAVTIDHALRAESAAEAAFVGQLCARAGIRHKILRRQGGALRAGVQAAARQARYALLAQAAKESGAALICAAHTQDDQAETYLMRQARLYGGAPNNGAQGGGAGAAQDMLRRRGLSAMARLSLLCGKYWLLRPLLAVRRADLRVYLQSRGIKWLDDPSNGNAAYERVRIRCAMSAAERAAAAAAAERAAAARQDLSARAAAWGRKLAVRARQDRFGAQQLCFDLSPLAAKQLQQADFAALYLLLASAAALCGGKTYIAPANARLWQFLRALPQSGKGEKPLRISVSGAVAEKRRQSLMIAGEKRNFTRAAKAGGAAARAGEAEAKAGEAPAPAGIFGLGGGSFSAGLYGGLVSIYDAPLYAVFAQAVPISGAAAALSEKDGKTAPLSWQKARSRLC